MARSLEIPAVVGTGTITKDASNGDVIIVDGLAGEIVINPSEKEIEAYKQKQADFEKQKKEWAKLKNEPTVTKEDRKSTRLNSSHVAISYAVFCLKKKKT